MKNNLRKKTAKKAKKDAVKKVWMEVIISAVLICAVSVALALMYTGTRVLAGVDKINTDEKTAAPVPEKLPVAEPVKKYKIPLKYKYLFSEHVKKDDIPKIHLEEAKVLFESGKAQFIDARSQGEYNKSHMPGSVFIGAGFSPEKINEYKEKLKDKVLVTYCHGAGCHLSDKVAFKLFDMGYKKLAIYFGGWPEWTQAGMPVEDYQPPEQYKHLFENVDSADKIQNITFEDAKFLYDNNLAVFIDAGSTEQFRSVNIRGSLSLTPDKIEQTASSYLNYIRQKPVAVVYCHGKGGKAENASKYLYGLGLKKVLVAKRLLPQWEKHNMPVNKRRVK